MAYGFEIPTALGGNKVTDLSSFRVFSVETKTETVTTSPQTFTYSAPSGWNSSNGTFYILPNSDGILPNFSVSGATTIEASFASFNSLFKATSWVIYWLVKTGNDSSSGFGILVSNSNGETVLSDETETLLVESSGTLPSYTTTNSGFRLFSTPSGFSDSDSVIFVKVPDGHDFYAISRLRLGDPRDLNLCSTTQTSLDYFVVRESFSLTPTSGYGLEIYSPSGDLVYSDGYDLFPSNGKTYTAKGVSPTTESIDGTKDLWVALNFGIGVPFCPDGGAGSFPTFQLVAGVKRVGSTVETEVVSVVDDPPSARAVSDAHDNTALLAQR